jgi:hypothetical protein
MKKYSLGVCAMLLAFMLGPPGKLSADTVSLTLKSVSPSLGGYFVAPYQFSVNGSSQTVGLICDDASDDVTVGESWTATTETFSQLSASGTVTGFLFSQGFSYNPAGTTTGASTISQYQAYAEAGWLATQIYTFIGDGDTTDAGLYQYALWDVFVPNFSASAGAGLAADQQSAVATDLSAAQTSYCSGPGCYSNLVIYTPTSWSSSDTRPQEYFGIMPEPMTVWSLLVVLAAIALACKWVDKTTVKSSVSASV